MKWISLPDTRHGAQLKWIGVRLDGNGCANALTELRRLARKLLRLTAPLNARVPPRPLFPVFPRPFPGISRTFPVFSDCRQAVQFVRAATQPRNAETEPQFEFVLPFGVVMAPPRHPHPYPHPHPHPTRSRHVLFVCLRLRLRLWIRSTFVLSPAE